LDPALPKVYKNRELRVTGTIYCTNFYGNSGGGGDVEYSGIEYQNGGGVRRVQVRRVYY